MMKTIYLPAALAVLSACSLYAQDVAGDWHGTLKVGPIEMGIQLHIVKADKGLTASMDSPDQGIRGMAVDSISLEGSDLKFAVGAVQVTYAGKVSPDGKSIDGTLTQGQAMPLDLTRGNFAVVQHKPGKPSDIDGDWKGALQTPNGNLRIVFHIVNTADGLTATADLPDVGGTGLPVANVTRTGQTLKMDMKQMGGGFEGDISPDLKTITGNFSAAGNKIAMVLTR